jgi:type I restriction enzyme S subunit
MRALTESAEKLFSESGGATIPEGWTWASVQEVTENVPNIKPESEPTREFGYVDISSICNQTYSVTDPKRFRGKDAPSRARRPIQANDVLFSNVRTYLRNIALVSDNLDAELCSTGFTVLRSNGAIDPRLLFHQVLTDRFIDLVTPQQTGSQYPATSDRVVMAASIPLPPLSEQHRIVGKVEECLSHANSARNHLSQVPVILKRFRQAVLAAACSGRLTEDWREERREVSQSSVSDGIAETQTPDHQDLRDLPSGWTWVRLGSLGSDPKGTVQTGPFGAQLHRDEFTTTGIPVIAVGNLTGMGFTTDGLYYISERKAQQLAKYDVQAGDVLFARSGATLGKVCVAPEFVNNWRMTGHILRARFNSHVMLPEFAVYSLHGDPEVKAQVMTNVRGVTRPGFNTTLLETIRLPLPTMPEQREILSRVRTLFKIADSIEARLKVVRKYSDALTQSILAKAFRGELVPTEAELARREGREYESASVLLERIRKERESRASSKPERKRTRMKSKLAAAKG